MSDHDKPSSFYLGREFDPVAATTTSDKVLYQANDLTTHAVCIGMTGSGKTGLCISLIEEALLDGVPVIAIDPKGDLGNLLLAFPELKAIDFEPWVDPATATRQGLSTAQLAEQTAARWQKGLAQWDQNGERIARFNSAADKVIYTPGSTAGVPLTVLKSFHAPATAVIEDADTYNDLVQSTTQGVLALVGAEADPVQSPEAILIAKVFDHAWRAGQSLDLSGLIHDLQKPPFSKVGIVDLESFLPAKDRLALGMRINHLLASPSFASWLTGESLDVESLLYTTDGKPRLSILSISHLGDAERMFFVTILLNEVLSWMRTQPGTGSLRAILYMDEVFGYFPPSANPPSKRPMLTLLKQARAYGLGVVLATQNPVDLDYKGLSNAGTWFLGRLQTERDKLRVLEGLESASTAASSGFDRQRLDALLSSLRSRVFLVNNIHADGPKVIETRWAMSYLRGPLTRDQIRTLMKDRRATSAVGNDPPAVLPEASHSSQPILSNDIDQKFWPPDGKPAEGCHVEFRPALYGRGKLHFVQKDGGIDQWQELAVLQPIHGELSDPVWRSALTFERLPILEDAPSAVSRFVDLPSALAQEKNYRAWERELREWLYQTQRHIRWRYAPTAALSKSGETEEEFRQELVPEARLAEQRLIEREFDAKIQQVRDAIAKTESQATKHKWWWLSGISNMLWRAIEIIMTRLLGGRSRKQLVTVASTSQMSRGRRHHAEAQEKLEQLRGELSRLEGERSRRVAELSDKFQPESLILDKLEVSPRKGDIDLAGVSLVWLPWQVDADHRAQPLY